jgi:hypothetical protein
MNVYIRLDITKIWCIAFSAALIDPSSNLICQHLLVELLFLELGIDTNICELKRQLVRNLHPFSKDFVVEE